MNRSRFVLQIYAAILTGWVFASLQAGYIHHQNASRLWTFEHSAAYRIAVRHMRAIRVDPFHRTRLLVTAYDISPRANGGRCTRFPGDTATGVKVHEGSIAVDPRVFPFGSQFYIPGYGYGVADDTGSMIRGHHIDIAIASCSRAREWGARHLVADVRTP